MNFKVKYTIGFICILILSSLRFIGQNINNDYYDEILDVTTDRDLYAAGENIFFQIYCRENNSDKELISKILYIELININEKAVVFKGKFKIQNNNSNGYFEIPENASSGVYILKVYTQFMRNGGISDNFDKYISIVNPEKENTSDFITHDSSISIIPSNYTLLKNVPDNVTIFIPEDIRTSFEYQILTDNKTSKNIYLKNGFDNFEAIFSDTVEYSVLRISQTGDSLKYPFPKVYDNGIYVSLKEDNSVIKYKIANTDAVKDQRWTLKIFGENKELLLSKSIFTGSNISEEYIETNLLKKGLNYIVLFNSEGETEKIHCIWKRTRIDDKILIKTNKDEFSQRESVSLMLSSPDNVIIGAAVSVILNGTNQYDFGFIPEYLFQNENLLIEYLNISNNLTDDEIKNILRLYGNYLTSSKKDYFIQKKNKNNEAFIVPDIREVSLSGIVKNKLTAEPVSDIKVFLSSFKNNPQFHTAHTDKYGKFVFSLNKFYDTNDLYVCTESSDKYNIFLNNPYENHLFNDTCQVVFFNSDSKEILKNLYTNAQIQKKFTNSSVSRKNVREQDFNIIADFNEYNLDDYIELDNFKEVIDEIVYEVRLKENQDNTYSFIIYDSNGNVLPGRPLVLLDNIPIIDISKIVQTEISAIDKISVLNQPYILGKNIINGIIMIQSNTDDLCSIDFSDSGIFLKYDGLQNNENYNFSYNYKETRPDFRNTLFWSSDVKIDKDGAEFEFTASDFTGTYKIVVKGYDAENNPVYSSKYIRVVRKND